MRKSVDLSIQFRKNGQDGCVSVTIDFISNYAIKTHADLNRDMFDFMTTWNNLSDKRSKLAALMAEGAKPASAEIQKVTEEIIKDSESLTIPKYQIFIERRFNLIKLILTDNKVTDERLLSFDFWDNCIDPSDMIDFLEQAISKDVSKKKLNMMKQLSTTTG